MASLPNGYFDNNKNTRKREREKLGLRGSSEKIFSRLFFPFFPRLKETGTAGVNVLPTTERVRQQSEVFSLSQIA
jgi:hypothetical protein